MLWENYGVSEQPIPVAVGLVFNEREQILIAQRTPQQEQGGLWEFPGGKLEAAETVGEALIRELKEEVGIDVLDFTQLETVDYAYGTKKVRLFVCRITAFSGEARGCEGQAIRWVVLDELQDYPFPSANEAIIAAHCSAE